MKLTCKFSIGFVINQTQQSADGENRTRDPSTSQSQMRNGKYIMIQQSTLQIITVKTI